MDENLVTVDFSRKQFLQELTGCNGTSGMKRPTCTRTSSARFSLFQELTMKSLFSSTILATAILVAATLTGCAASPAPQHSRPQRAISTMGSGGHSGPQGAMNMSDSEMMTMCRDIRTQILSAKTPEEQQVMMAEHRKHMSPEMMQHCSMMRGQQGAQPSSR